MNELPGGASRASRILLAAAGLAFLLVGIVFFALPSYSAENFPWNVSPFVAMTIGGWAIGTGLIALDAARRWELRLVYASLVFVWAFSAFELVVVAAFLGVLRTDHWLTWPYLVSLGLGLASGVVGLPMLLRQRAALHASGVPVPTWVRPLILTYAVAITVLAVIALIAVPAGGRVFPEPLTPFTTRAFSAFFLALVVGIASLIPSRDLRGTIYFAAVGNLLIFPITIAALLNLDKFDFIGRPGGLLYIGAYLLAAVVQLFAVAWYRRRYGNPLAAPRT